MNWDDLLAKYIGGETSLEEESLLKRHAAQNSDDPRFMLFSTKLI